MPNAPMHPAARIFAALASDSRLRLLDYVNRLPTRTADSHELAEQLGLHLSTVLHHAAILVRAGLLTQLLGPTAANGGSPRYAWQITSLARELVGQVARALAGETQPATAGA